MTGPRRILFLDDDADRAMAFLASHPEAVWVETVADCIARLGDPWDEIHLDHDLGGEVFVDHERDDCGMAVVRWLGQEPRPHLAGTQFVVHSHNANAACMMALHLQVMGFRVLALPFGVEPPQGSGTQAASRRPSRLVDRLASWIRGLRDPIPRDPSS